MQCPKCSDGTHLVQTTYEKTNDTACSCGYCGWNLLPNKEYWTCSSCSYRLCHLCQVCPKGHLINRVKVLNKTASPYHGNSYMCDNCKKSASPGADGVWHCVPCQFDLCEDCAPFSK